MFKVIYHYSFKYKESPNMITKNDALMMQNKALPLHCVVSVFNLFPLSLHRGF